MKKYLLNSFLFSVFAFIFYCGFVLFTGYVGTDHPKIAPNNLKLPLGKHGHLYTRMLDLQDERDLDILFIGPSTCFRSYDVRIFEGKGYSAFNLGSSGQTPIQTLELLKLYIDQLNPKLIIYEVNPYTFGADGVEASVDLITNSPINSETYVSAYRLNHFMVYNAMIYGIMRDQIGLHADFREDQTIAGDTYVAGGYVEKEPTINTTEQPVRNQILRYKDRQIVAFKEIISLLEKNGVEYKLVQAPRTSIDYKSIKNNTEIDAKLSKYGTYYNFNGKVRLSDTLHFFDNRHLNQAGVEIYNAYLIEELGCDANSRMRSKKYL